ncbi:hypothetical protein [Flavobacterium aquidurense]|uniref:Uncharacterized protein n=1 Tax=Flavobacterium aquidurense TaxID=362413 RepID=A0A0Q0S7D7_9FLAO|nr:hypothetical protein [Flavobacterium aquidurense]KQB39467.1 hypothetical protein RC62_1148 [Flavobacterium aquidurense]
MDRTFRIKEVNGDNSFQDKKLVVKRDEINLLIVLELGGKAQFDRTFNDIWKVVKLNTIDIDSIKKLNEKYDYKNICIVHHGNIFSDTALGSAKRVELMSYRMKEIKNVISKLEPPAEVDEAYAVTICDKSKTIYKKGTKLTEIKGFLGLKLLIGQLLDNGTFISVACNEADDSDFLAELADFTDKKIKIFGNTNFSFIDDGRGFEYNNLTLNSYHSILNSYLSSAWQNKNGWMYYDTSTQKLEPTKKELWLHSMGKKIYTLLERKSTLTQTQIDKQHYAQLYFSKKYKVFHEKYVTTISYNNWKKEMEKKYPDFK